MFGLGKKKHSKRVKHDRVDRTLMRETGLPGKDRLRAEGRKVKKGKR